MSIFSESRRWLARLDSPPNGGAARRASSPDWGIDITELLLQQGIVDVSKIPAPEREAAARNVAGGLMAKGLQNPPGWEAIRDWFIQAGS